MDRDRAVPRHSHGRRLAGESGHLRHRVFRWDLGHLWAYGYPTPAFSRSGVTLSGQCLKIAFALMLLVMALLAGRSIPAMDFRVIWLAALFATGIHFIPLVLVHGPPMLWLAFPLSANSLFALLSPGLAFVATASFDAAVKVGFGGDSRSYQQAWGAHRQGTSAICRQESASGSQTR